MGTISLGQLYSLGTHFPATERIDPAEDCLMFLTGSPTQPPIPSLFSSTLHQHQGYMDVPCLTREEFTGKSFSRPPPPPLSFRRRNYSYVSLRFLYNSYTITESRRAGRGATEYLKATNRLLKYVEPTKPNLSPLPVHLLPGPRSLYDREESEGVGGRGVT